MSIWNKTADSGQSSAVRVLRAPLLLLPSVDKIVCRKCKSHTVNDVGFGELRLTLRRYFKSNKCFVCVKTCPEPFAEPTVPSFVEGLVEGSPA